MTKSLGACSNSLQSQTYENFEVVVVDQNEDERVSRVADGYRASFPLLIANSAPGLSKARNIGLRMPLGDIVAIPDDDCWYPEKTLSIVAKIFTDTPGLAGVTGKSIDENRRPSQGRWSDVGLLVNSKNVWIAATSYTIFLRREVFANVGNFDETLGVGSGTKWGSGEEIELLLRALKAGYAIRYVTVPRNFSPGADPSYRRQSKSAVQGLQQGNWSRPSPGWIQINIRRHHGRKASRGRSISLRLHEHEVVQIPIYLWYQRLRGWLDSSPGK